MRKILTVVFALLVACTPSQEIKPEPSAEAPQGQNANCGAIGHAELIEPITLTQANYEVLVSACVARSTWGWIDVTGLLGATSAVDVHVVASVDGTYAGPELQAPLGPALGTFVGGAVYVAPGKHLVDLRVATGAPDAFVTALAGSWIRGEARQELPTP